MPIPVSEYINAVSIIEQYKCENNLLIVIDKIKIDLLIKVVWLDDNIVNFTKKEYDFFVYLIQNRNNIITKKDALKNIWDIDFEIESNIIDVYLNFIRKKIKKLNNNIIIKTKKNRILIEIK